MADFSFLTKIQPPSICDHSGMRNTSNRMIQSYSSVCAGIQSRSLKSLGHDHFTESSEVSNRQPSCRSFNQETYFLSESTTPSTNGTIGVPDRESVPTVDDFLADEFCCRSSICHYLSEGYTCHFDVDCFDSEECNITQSSNDEQSTDSAPFSAAQRIQPPKMYPISSSQFSESPLWAHDECTSSVCTKTRIRSLSTVMEAQVPSQTGDCSAEQHRLTNLASK
jgi:hypothetical protein